MTPLGALIIFIYTLICITIGVLIGINHAERTINDNNP